MKYISRWDKKEEELYRELSNLSRKLRVPRIPEVFLILEVKDARGEVLALSEGRAHSFTRNYYNLMLAMATTCALNSLPANSFGIGFLSMKATSGTVYENDTIPTNASWEAGANDDTRSIVVGSDGTPEDPNGNDYVLGSQIASGNGVGELLYSACEQPTETNGYLTYVGTTWTAEWRRYFNNNSGGNVIVRETGLYLRLNFDGVNDYYLLIRDAFAAITVPDTAQLRVSYTLSYDMPID